MNGSPVAIFSGGGTGGHLYPALALAGALEERRPDIRTFFIGAQRGLESRVLPRRGVEHLLVRVEGFQRGALLANLGVVWTLVHALVRVAEVFQRLRPHLVVVTGGYAGGPAGLLAVLTRTRLVLQEQNSVPGLTTRVLSLFAKEIHVAFPEAVGFLPRRSRRRAFVTGNPVQPPVPRDRVSAAAAFQVEPGSLVVLVVGGSQGSEALNAAVLDVVLGVAGGTFHPKVDVQWLWATGPSHLEGIREQLLRVGFPEWVKTLGYIDDMPLALSLADVAVSRAGAMATSEFLAWGIPSILVPLPTAAANHQTRNAEALSKVGAALHLPQGKMSGEVLWREVERLVSDSDLRAEMATAARGRGRPHAATDIANSLERLLPPSSARSNTAKSDLEAQL